MNISETLTSPPPIYTPDLDDTRADASAQNQDPFKFGHGLTGVDQQTNFRLVHIILATILAPTILLACFRFITRIRARRRRRPKNFSQHENGFWSRSHVGILRTFRRSALYAPAGLTPDRPVTREKLQLIASSSSTWLQTAIVCTYAFCNLACCLAIPNQPLPQGLAAFRGRCGTFATFNLVLTILFALRNSPFIWLLHISYDTSNFFHRWTARLVVLQTIAHVFAFAINTYNVTYNGRSGFQSIVWVLQHSLSYEWGFTAFIAFTSMTILSISPLRHAFYETFLTVHRLSAVLAISGIYFHIGKHALPQLSWVYLTVVFVVSEYLIRVFRVLRTNFAWKDKIWTQVTLDALPGDATRVTFALPRSWRTNPGSSVHVYLPRVALWSSHPFSIAWVESSGYEILAQEKLPEDFKIKRGNSTISCIVRARNGMTRSLYELAASGKADSLCLWGAIEGPYGGYHSLDSHDTVILFAAGVGITHQLLFVRHLLAGYTTDTIAVRNILLVWCVTTVDCVNWVSPWLGELASMPGFRKVVRISLHVSRATTTELTRSSLPPYMEVRRHRCDPGEHLEDELYSHDGSLAVSVCGPTSFSADVRAAVRDRSHDRDIDLFDESFTY